MDNLKFEDYEQFSYHGRDFVLLLSDQEAVDSGDRHDEAFFTVSTMIDGYDIYILDSLSLETKKRMVFHEIVEADLQWQGFEEPIAHPMAEKAETEVYGERKPKSDQEVDSGLVK